MIGRSVNRLGVQPSLLVVLTILLALPCAGWAAPPPPQPQPAGSNMAQRLEQLYRQLEKGQNCEAIDAALTLAPDLLWAGLRMLRSKDLLEQTTRAAEVTGQNELRLAEALEAFVETGRCREETARALDLKFFIENINEVARAVGEITARCGDGDDISEAPCNELQPLLDEETGHELIALPETHRIIRPSYSVKLRSPFLPPWILGMEKDVRVTDPIKSGECVVIFKEFMGLAIKLHFRRIIIVNDPWESVFGVPRGTRVAIWVIEFVPTQYAKQWNICNPCCGKLVTTTTQQVKQDIPLNYFWRLYRKDP